MDLGRPYGASVFDRAPAGAYRCLLKGLQGPIELARLTPQEVAAFVPPDIKIVGQPAEDEEENVENSGCQGALTLQK